MEENTKLVFTMKKFKNEFRFACSDTWGDAVEAWFECAGQLFKRGEQIPDCWEYSPVLGSDGTDENSYWYELFENAKTVDLIVIGNFLFRYCKYLKFKKVGY